MPTGTIVKLSHPLKKYGYEDVGARGQSPGNAGVWGDYTFEINTEVNECDFWVVFESVPEKMHACVPEGNTIVVLNEPDYVRSYSAEYLRQFDWVVTWRNDVPSDRIIHTYCMDGWWVKRTYDQLKRDAVEKRGVISVVASDKAALSGHRRRYAFINQLMGHFKDRLDVFGSVAGAYCHDKYEALAPYKYSIAIEAAEFPDYWTEKIADCFLCETMPLYFGCPNIGDYFPSDTYVPIDIDDYRSSIRAIEAAIEGNAYEQHRQQIVEAKRRVLDELQVYPHLVRILEHNKRRFSSSPRRKRVELLPATKQLEPLTVGGWQRQWLA